MTSAEGTGVTGSLFDRGSSAGMYVDSLGIEKDMLAHMNFIMGAPGTGKTTALGAIWKQFDEHSVRYYVTYNRSMGKEARERLGGDKRTVGTFHSICTRLLGWKVGKGKSGIDGDFLTDAQISDFAARYSIEKKGVTRPWEEDSDIEHHDELSQIMMAWSVARNQVPEDSPNNWRGDANRDLELLLHHYRQYKHELGDKKDYDDVLEETVRLEEQYGVDGPLPRCDLLLIDEAQDLTPLMWKLCDLWSRKAETVVIAGDDDQSIYSFRGVDVHDYLGRITALNSGRLFILKRSYRLSSEILIHAGKTIDGVSNRISKDIEPAVAGGIVEYARSLDNVVKSKGKRMVLCSSGWLMQEISSIVDARYPDVILLASNPKHQGRLLWSQKMIELVRIISRFPNLSREEFRFLASCLPASGLLKRGVKTRVRENRFFSADAAVQQRLDSGSADEAEILSAFEGTPTKEQLVRQLDYRGKKKEVMLRWIGREITDDCFVYIGTYHAAKGLEADTVGLVLDIGRKWMEQQTSNPDGVRRLLYVARSRAKSYHVEISLGIGEGVWSF